MKKAITFNGYKYEILEKWNCIQLEIVGFNNGHRLACFEFNKDDESLKFDGNEHPIK